MAKDEPKKPTQEFRKPTGEIPKAGQRPGAGTFDAGEPARKPGAPAAPADPKKSLESSQFYSGAEMNALRSKLPSVWAEGAGTPPPEEGLQVGAGLAFNGRIPANEVTSPDLWKALHPPFVSHEGKRDGALYKQVINQFAAAVNPRYEPDGDKHRGHILVWDVTRAMGVEIPHLLGARELNLIQTVDWLRFESSQRGWVKLSPERALEHAASGKPVVVVNKDGKSKAQAMAVVRPQPAGADGNARVASAGPVRGNDLSAADAMPGVLQFEFFGHA